MKGLHHPNVRRLNPKTNSVRLLLPGNKTTSCTHTRRQIVHRGDVTLSWYSPGQTNRHLDVFITSPFMCKRLQICGCNHVVKGFHGWWGVQTCVLPPANKSLTFKTAMCFMAKTKPQYQSNKKKRQRPFLWCTGCFILKGIRFTGSKEALNQPSIFRITHRDNLYFYFSEKKRRLSSVLAYSIKCFWQVE